MKSLPKFLPTFDSSAFHYLMKPVGNDNRMMFETATLIILNLPFTIAQLRYDQSSLSGRNFFKIENCEC